MDKIEKEIIKELQPLFEKADREGLWFYSTYQHLWFSPRELRESQSEGRFIWRPINWILRNPEEKLKELEEREKEIYKDIADFRCRIESSLKSKGGYVANTTDDFEKKVISMQIASMVRELLNKSDLIEDPITVYGKSTKTNKIKFTIVF